MSTPFFRRRALRVVGAGLGALVALVVFALTPVSVPERSSFRPSLAEIRALAAADPATLATEVRALQVAESQMPELAVVAGRTGTATIAHYTYQIVYPDRTVMLDAVHDAALLVNMPSGTVSSEAYARMQEAMAHADRIVATHEHFDHVGGIAHARDFAAIRDKVALTEEQLASTKLLDDSGFTPTQRQALHPLHVDPAVAIAPGAVLVKAPGHTPGSVMLYLRLASGAELLFIGDIAWHRDNIALPRTSPRLVHWIGHMDGAALADQLAFLHDLATSAPEVHIVVAHDGEQMADYQRAGLIQDGLR